MRTSPPVRTWAQFDRIYRNAEARLFADLPRFADVILVAGCQRSGTTAVTRILREALAMPCPSFTSDDELDAALILNGAMQFEPGTRCCFQTTYMNDHVAEYFEHDNYRLIWILRNPESVVRSMLYHWRRGALNRLFRACGRHALDDQGAQRYQRFGNFGFRRVEMACLSYNVKTAQLHEIAAKLGPERLYILDYDDLINRSDFLLPDIFSFASVPYDDRYLGHLRGRDAAKREQMNETLRNRVRDTCEPVYRRAIDLARNWR